MDVCHEKRSGKLAVLGSSGPLCSAVVSEDLQRGGVLLPLCSSELGTHGASS